MLQVEGVGKRYGSDDDAVVALEDVSLTVADGEFAALVGPSGCGKTTLLNLIAGLDDADQGRIVVDGETPAPEDRLTRFGYMPQQDMLFPWRTVLENVSLGLEVQGVPTREARRPRGRAVSAVRSRRIRAAPATRTLGRDATARQLSAHVLAWPSLSAP